LLTCEPVLTETGFLLTRQKVEAWRLLDGLDTGALRIALHLEAEAAAVRDLMSRYSNIPMSLADACLVRLAEMSGLPICTLDSDFTIYRASRRKRLALIMPQPLR
jgi:predicted nucleic acid-binding protein